MLKLNVRAKSVPKGWLKYGYSTAAAAECPFNHSEELKNAKPVQEIPGPKKLPFIGMIHNFLPGGKYFKMSMKDLHLDLRREYGDLVLMPGMMGKPDLVVTYDAEDIAKLYRNEGQWPHRRSFDVFHYFRTHERPDLFKGIAGLLSE